MNKVQLSSGRTVEYGGKQHILELDNILVTLDNLRNKIIKNDKSLSKEKNTISRAIESIQLMKNKIEKENKKKALSENMTLEALIRELVNR